MNKLYKALSASCIALLSGCATVGPVAEKVSNAERTAFFSPPSSEKAAVFFVCGTWKTESWLMNSTTDMPGCALEINGMPQKRILKNQVGRVDVSPGTLNLAPVKEDSLATYVPLKVEVRAGEVVLVTQNLVHRLGALGGALSGGFVHSLEWTKEQANQKASVKEPVRMN